MEEAGYTGAVCFTCGNAADALRGIGVDVLEVGPRGDIVPRAWWSAARIRKVFPGLFDATSGHFPHPLFAAYVGILRDRIKAEPGAQYDIPTGSGETVLALRTAFPQSLFRAVYGTDNSVKYDAEAPLAELVRLTGPLVIP